MTQALIRAPSDASGGRDRDTTRSDAIHCREYRGIDAVTIFPMHADAVLRPRKPLRSGKFDEGHRAGIGTLTDRTLLVVEQFHVAGKRMDGRVDRPIADASLKTCDPPATDREADNPLLVAMLEQMVFDVGEG